MSVHIKRRMSMAEFGMSVRLKRCVYVSECGMGDRERRALRGCYCGVGCGVGMCASYRVDCGKHRVELFPLLSRTPVEHHRRVQINGFDQHWNGRERHVGETREIRKVECDIWLHLSGGDVGGRT
jgi:hypothetical protein